MAKMKIKPEMGPEGPAESTKIESGEMSMPSEMAPEKYVASAEAESQASAVVGMGDAARLCLCKKASPQALLHG